MTLIKAEQISKSFGEGMGKTQVLRQVNLEIDRGDFACIMGPSGSGKSTLLFALSAMDRLDEGKVSFNDRSLYDLDERELADIRRKEMGFVFQDATMINSLDILDNILLPSYDRYKENREELEKKARQVMDRIGIAGLENRQITEVSGGQLQRASICRAILHDPEILFGDEPTGALNSRSTEEILDLFCELNKEGMTILLVTHDAQVAARAKKVFFMKDGHLESALVFDEEDTDLRLKQITDRMVSLQI